MVFHIYCDESRQTRDRYMVLGGLIIPANYVVEFNETFKKFREEQKMYAELKWTKVTDQMLPRYKRFVEYFFALNNTDRVHFHCIIVDNHQVDHKKFSRGDKELGFYKFYYQLLLHCFGKKYCRKRENDRFIVYLDYRNTRYSLRTLKIVLNRGMNKKFSIDTNPFVTVEPRRSKQEDLLQITDILIGSIGFQKNGYHLLSGSRKSKIELVDYIANFAGLNDLCKNSPRGNNRFTVWNFKLRK